MWQEFGELRVEGCRNGCRRHPIGHTVRRCVLLKGAQKQLKQATKEIYGGDEYMTKLAETTVNIEAKEE